MKVLAHYCNLGTYFLFCGPGSSVDIATDYGLDGPGIESQSLLRATEQKGCAVRKGFLLSDVKAG